jgi:hypothetical protein
MTNQDCTGAPGECGYPDGTICTCGNFLGPMWICYTPSGACPLVVPNAGTPCASEGLTCPYDGCNMVVVCSSGLWGWSGYAC